ncbi:MAG TPA: phosphoribosylglycinamide synthetase C domain-containing protein, partial [Cellulomonadaceae bacterium]|nr:phosphoribosylglycinamide synthetase C domain-containing protein [Cellulomonadaceae bacterium]
TVGLPLQPAQDFKRVGDGDAGPNTGGMGAYTPLSWAPDGLVEAVMERVVAPTLAEMTRRGTPFAGLLYVGLALTSRGMRVVEFNARFGDPETQAILPLLESPLGQVLYAAATGTLAQVGPFSWRDESAVIVVAAADGYPGTPRTGGSITGPRLYESTDNVHIVHAGTALDGDTLVAAGGRVLGAVATAPTLIEAREDAYAALDQLDFPTGFWRTDIAAKAAAGLIPSVTSL